MSTATIAGFRIVRKLGSGSRADVFLGYPEAEERSEKPVAIKVHRPGVEQASIGREIEALDRAPGDHCVRLLDLATDPAGLPALILERLPLGPLGRLLTDRPRLRTGECITILAPICLTVGGLHDLGVTHGGIALESIGFRDDGAPVLLGFGAARAEIGRVTPASLAASPAVARDLESLAAVALAVLQRAEGAGESAIARLQQWMSGVREPGRFAQELAERLFELADPSPVSFRPLQSSMPVAVPSRLGPHPATTVVPSGARLSSVESATGLDSSVRLSTDPLARGIGGGAGAPEDRPRSPFLASLHLPHWLEEVVGPRLDALPLSGLGGRMRATFSSVRKPVWFAAGAVGVALLVALSVVPPQPPAAPPQDRATSRPPEVSATPSALSGDDPLAALPELLEARTRCIADLSLLCLDTVDQFGSPALAADQELIRAIQDGAELPSTIELGDDVTLVERLGGSALIDLGTATEPQPASVLLVKGEAGWRVRAWLD